MVSIRTKKSSREVFSSIGVHIKPERIAYPIITGEGVIEAWGQWWRDQGLLDHTPCVITDHCVRRLHGRRLQAALQAVGFRPVWTAVPVGEPSKSWHQAERVMAAMTRHQPGRRLFVIAFGGGVVGDLAGFVACVYRRGVPLIQIPTTLLAQVDSAIGGKVGVDLPAGKNLAGAFYHPRAVFCDTVFLRTLSERQLRNGMAEVVKYGAIADPAVIRMLEQGGDAWLDSDRANESAGLIRRCAMIKARIVSQDEREQKGKRTILNFGHTFAHAIEAADGFKRYQHGEAVGLGMRAAVWLSVRQGGLSLHQARRIHRLLDVLGFDRRVSGLTPHHILKPMAQDKKFQGKVRRFVLLKRLGRAYVDASVPEVLVLEAVKRLITGQYE